MISVCFLIALFTTSYSVSTTFLFLQIPSGSQNAHAFLPPGIPNSEALIDTASRFLSGTSLASLFTGVWENAGAVLIDLFSAKLSVFFTSLRAASIVLTEDPGPAVVFLITGVFLAVIYQFFISNILLIGEKRFFLENRKYRQTPVSKIFCLFKLSYVRHPAWVMFCRAVFQVLWSLTIVGGIIKYYEYRMIPYILAENPKISRKDAFFLTKQLMRHNKYKLFLLHLSFAGWKILSLFTFGLLDFLFVNPYLTGTEAELYLNLRRNYILSRSPRYECLNDSYLEHVPSEDELLISKALYDDSRGPYTQISYFAPEQYPVFLFSVQPPFKAVKASVKSDRTYTFLSCVFLFHAFSILGWLCEMSVQLLANGTTEGLFSPLSPWMPVYGIFGTLILLICRRFIHKPVLVFLLNFVFYSVLEFGMSWVAEFSTGSQPWDYSGYSFNIDGRIYAGGSIAAALLGCAFLYYLAPRMTGHFMRLRKFSRNAICVCLTLLFLANIIVRVAVHS